MTKLFLLISILALSACAVAPVAIAVTGCTILGGDVGIAVQDDPWDAQP